MRPSIQLVAGALLGLLIGTGAAAANNATTTTSLSLREGPDTGYAVVATLPAGARVDVRTCKENWCGVFWKGQRGYAFQGGLEIDATAVIDPEIWPVYPAYPYRAGHYPKADWYYDMPPYTAIAPSFYRERFRLTRGERNRYRYMPHVFGSGRPGGWK